MGSLKQRGRIWWLKYYRNGRRHEESSHSESYEVARDLLRTREGDIAKGLPITAKVGQIKIDEAFDDVIRDYQVNGKKTLGHVKRRITLHLGPYFGGRRMATITTSDVLDYTAKRQEAGASNAEINRELSILKRAFSLEIKAGRFLQKPHIPMLAEDNTRTGFFEREQFESVRRHLPGPLQGVATFAYVTGWRVPSEVLTLQWAQVDRRAGTVRLEVGTTKNKRGRVFPYAQIPELAAVVEDQWTIRDGLKKQGTICPWVFHRKGKPIADFRTAWENATKAAGCPGRIPHDFRRTAVRNLVRAGVPEKTAMTLTGHKTRAVFDRYDIVDEADLVTAARQLAGTLGASDRAAKEK